MTMPAATGPDFLQHLDELGVPIWTEIIHAAGKLPTRPVGWQQIGADNNQQRIATQPPGAAICANMGGPIAVVDVDTKNGAQVDKIRAALDGAGVRIYADILTPSGGRHFYVPGHPDLPTVHAKADREGLTGYPGVEILSYGTNVFLPGSQRAKYAGAPYLIISDELEVLADGGDRESAENLAAWVAAHRIVQAEQFEIGEAWDGTAPDRRQQAYLQAAVQRRVDAISAMGPESGRNTKCFEAGLMIGNYAAGAGLNAELAGQQILDAAAKCGLVAEDGEKAVRATISSGIRLGMTRPRQVPPAENLQLAGLAPERRLAAVPDLPNGSRMVNGRESTSDPVAKPDTAADDEPHERTTWWPTPLVQRSRDAAEEPEPTHLRREDGRALFYSGKVNGLIGESESGKSWIALLAVVQALEDDQPVLMLDFEDSPASIHRRMTALGMADHLLEKFDYANPDEALGAIQTEDLAEAIAAHQYRVILVDGVNAAMTMLGLDLNSNTDATKFTSKVLRPLTRNGTCVITVDHVPKRAEERGKGGIGAQAKRSMMDGCAISVEIVEPFGKGQSGILKLIVDKDRNGHVRGISAGGKNPGRAHIDSTGDTVQICITPPVMHDGDKPAWKPTEKMEAVSRFLEHLDGAATGNSIVREVTGKESTIKDAIAALVEGGYVTVESGPRNSILHRLIRPYRELLSPVSPPSPDRLPETAKRVSPDPSPPTGRETLSGDSEDTSLPPNLIDDEQSDCNRCGKRTLDKILDTYQGICFSCHSIEAGI